MFHLFEHRRAADASILCVQRHTSSGTFDTFACVFDVVCWHPLASTRDANLDLTGVCTLLLIEYVLLFRLFVIVCWVCLVSQHASCFRQWAQVAIDPMTCTVCKQPFGASFIASLIGLERVMFAGSNANEDSDDDDWDAWTVQNSVPVYEDELGSLWFSSVEHMTIFEECEKRTVSGMKAELLSKQRTEKRQQHHANRHSAKPARRRTSQQSRAHVRR